MQTYRYKVQTGGFGLFLGLAAETARLTTPPAIGVPVSDRVWLDASEVNHAYYGSRLALNERELAWLRLGLSKVAGGIQCVDSSPYILISVRTLQIIEVDYAEAALAPAIAGWAAAEFSLATVRCNVRRDASTGQFTFDWNE